MELHPEAFDVSALVKDIAGTIGPLVDSRRPSG